MSDGLFSDREQQHYERRYHQRYQRHMQLPGFGAQGQACLKHAHIVIVGMGGLGCPAAQYLAAAGVGTLTLVDADVVSLSNLQRQILFSENDIDRAKAVVARERLQQLNSDIQINAVTEALTLDNAPALIDAADIVIDCTDNFHTRYLINDLCSYYATPWVYSSVLGFSGQLALFNPEHSCFRCLFPKLSEVPDCNQAGVLGVVPGTLGTLQALETIKYLAKLGPYSDNDETTHRNNRLQQFAALEPGLRSIKLGRSPDCDICNGSGDYRNHLEDYQIQCAPLAKEHLLPADQLSQFVEDHQPCLIDVRSAEEHAQDNLGGINIPLETLADTDDLDTTRTYLLYCQSGIRSQQAVKILLDKGAGMFTIKSLEDGLNGQRKT